MVLRWASSRSQAPSSATGPFAPVFVAATTHGASAASAAESVAIASTPKRSAISRAKRSRRCGLGLKTFTRSTSRTASTASRFVRASRPEPMTPTSRQPSGAVIQRVATPVVAPVRAAVRYAASTRQSSSPVDGVNTAMRYRASGNFASNAFKPMMSSSSMTAGMRRKNPPSTPKLIRGTICTPPRASTVDRMLDGVDEDPHVAGVPDVLI